MGRDFWKAALRKALDLPQEPIRHPLAAVPWLPYPLHYNYARSAAFGRAFNNTGILWPHTLIH
jgi:hypothetical protein